MSTKFEKMSVFEQLRAGLADSVAWSKGQISLKTTALPAPPPKANAAHISALRRRLNMSQTVFAATMNVSPKTIQSWEQGTRVPSDAALRLVQVVGFDPGIVRQLFSDPATRSTEKTKTRRATRTGTSISTRGRKRKRTA